MPNRFVSVSQVLPSAPANSGITAGCISPDAVEPSSSMVSLLHFERDSAKPEPPGRQGLDLVSHGERISSSPELRSAVTAEAYVQVLRGTGGVEAHAERR